MAHEEREVQTTFTAHDALSGSVHKITSAFEKSAGHLERLNDRFKEFRREQGLTTLGALGLGYGIGSWIEHVKEANKEFAQTQKSLAGVLSSALSFDKGTDEVDRFNQSMTFSKGLTKELEEFGGKYNVQLEDTAAAYRSTAVAAGSLGLKTSQVSDLTEDAVAMAKRFGVSGEQAATGIARALQTGSVRGFDPFDQRLRQVLGNMKKLTQAQRFEHIEKALAGSKKIAEEMGKGIGGAMNRAKLAVDEVIRDATGPLFKEIGKSIEDWSKGIRSATEGAKPLVEIFSGKLVSAFHVLKDASKFIHEHFVAISAIFVGLKGFAIGEKISGAAAGLGGFSGAAGALGNFVGKLSAAAGAAGLLATAAAAAATAIGDHLIKKMEDQGGASEALRRVDILSKLAGNTRNGMPLLSHQQEGIAAKTIDALRREGIINEGRFNRQGLIETVKAMSGDSLAEALDKYGIKTSAFETTGSQIERLADVIEKRLTPAISMLTPGMEINSASKADVDRKFAKSPVNNFFGGIHIQQKFDEADPDRVFHRSLDEIEEAASRRTQSPYAEPLSD